MYCDELIYCQLKNGEVTSAESIKFILLALNIIKNYEQCPTCNEFLKLHLDNSKSSMIRFRCSSCRNRHDVLT